MLYSALKTEIERRWLYAVLALSGAVAVGIAAFLWPFNLDDKWIYYRTSLNVLSSGLPILNTGEWFNINTSFLYPYLTAPGHFLGDFRAWETWTKVLGLSFHLATAAIIVSALG
jgi:hypothetical protein